MKYTFTIITTLTLIFTACKKKEAEKVYTGTLTVLQKDAYSNVAGHSSDLWIPHTTTVFKWAEGEFVQANHGTLPGEVDANGDVYLVQQKVYTFFGTKKVMEALHNAYVSATFDPSPNTFLNLNNGGQVLEASFISGLEAYMADGANGLVVSGPLDKNALIALFAAGNYQEFASNLSNTNWTGTDWTAAFESVLGNVLASTGQDLQDYHVCNDDADLQVRLIKNYISNGTIIVPEKINDGPMFYYEPN